MREVTVTGPSGLGLTKTEVADLIDRTSRSEGVELKSVSVSFLSEAEMAKLNQQARGKTGATDVLSFPYDDSFPQGSGGEIVICPEAARKQDRPELRWLLVHGTLHLLGYEDDTAAGLDRMERRTAKILEAVGG